MQPQDSSAAASPASADRRDFLKSASAAGLGLALAPVLGAANAPATEGSAAKASAGAARKRFVIVGLGSRSRMYQEAINNTYREHAVSVGYCDLNPGRIEIAQKQAVAAGVEAPPAYKHTDFDRMIRETKPDAVIVTTVDSTHDEYIVRALELGCDAISEKPMTTTPEKAQRILDATKRTGKRVRVLFNYRYSPPRTQVKDILMSGRIGDIYSVDFQWLLNTHHGADYFRRWHSRKEFSGGLMIHKSTHHFDLVNWWLSAVPETVTAVGKREFYTPAMAKRFGLKSHHERCHTCPEKADCGFFLDLAANPNMKRLYLDQEKHDGYFRDRCVFRPDIDIEDTMNVIVKYDTGALLSYSLNAFNAWEGYMIAFNGTKGRLEHSIVEKVYVNGTNTEQGGIQAGGTHTRVVPLRGPAENITPWEGKGGHGGGDKLMLDELFLPSPPADKYYRASDEHGGAWSILIGAAANQGFVTGQPVKVADLVKGLVRPTYPAMPTREQAVEMPRRGSGRE